MPSSIKVIEAPFSINPDGLKVLQCHSRGDRRFSPFCCFVEAFGQKDSIETIINGPKFSMEILFQTTGERQNDGRNLD